MNVARKPYVAPSVAALIDYAETSCTAGSFGPAGCQAGVGDAVYCLVGFSDCREGSSASGGCGGGLTVV